MARSPAKRVVGTILFVVAVLLVGAFLFLLYAESANDESVPFTDQVPAAALVTAIALGVILVVLLLMLLIRQWDERAEEAESGEVFFVPDDASRPAAPGTEYVAGASAPEVVPYDVARVPQAPRSWAAEEKGQVPYYFPRSVASGVYVNDYVPIGNGRTLKLRTLMAGPDGPYALQATAARPAPRAEPEPRAEAQAAKSLVAAATRGRQAVVLQEAAPEPAKEDAAVYYDYPGDNHGIEDLEGIGQVYGGRLRALGVHTTARLAYEDAGSLAERLELPRKTVEGWKQMAELVKVNGIGPQYAEALVRAGIAGIAELKRRSPAKIAEQVNAYLDTLDTNVLGTKITEKRVEGWQANAKGLRRVRMQVPPQ